MPTFVGSTTGSRAWAKTPDSWLTIFTFTDEIHRFGRRALSDRGRFVEARLSEISAIERRASDKDGNYAPARMRVAMPDDDAFFRTRLGNNATRFYMNCHTRYDLLSREGRKADLDPRPLFKGRIVDIQPPVNRMITIEMQDLMGSFKGILDPDRKVGMPIGDEWPNKPKETVGLFYPIYMGIYSDRGETDINGDPVDRGVVPAIYLGESFMPGTTPDPEGRGSNPNQAHVINQVANNVVGGGTIPSGITVYMKVSPIDADGNIGPASQPLFLSPNTDIALKASWLKNDDVSPQYAVFLVTNPAFDPITNPAAGGVIQYKIQDGADLNGEYIGTTQFDYTQTFTSLTDGATWGIQKAGPPANLRYTIEGTTGTTERRYAVTSITENGESLPTQTLIVPNGPDVLNDTNRIVLAWDENDASVFRVITSIGNKAPTQSLAVVDGAVTYTHDGSDTPSPFAMPTSDNSIIGEDTWGVFAIAHGQVTVNDVYGSDVEPGETPKRTRLIDSDNVLTSESEDWPYPDRYITVQNSSGDNIDVTVILARGEVKRAHIENQVTIAANICGYKDANDLVIDQAYRMLLLLHNEFLELNDGEGYKSGIVGSAPIELFPDGDPKFWTSRYELAQQSTIDRIGDLGYRGVLFVPKTGSTLGELHRRFIDAFGGRIVSDNHGRMYPFTISTETEEGVGKLYRERMEIKRLEGHFYKYSELENRGKYRYLYNVDTQIFRSPDIPFEDADAIDSQGGERLGVYQRDPHQCFFSTDPVQIADRFAWELELYARPARYAQWVTDLEGVETYCGDPARFTHRKEGIGEEGDILTPGVIMDMIVRPKNKGNDYEIAHTVRLLGGETD